MHKEDKLRPWFSRFCMRGGHTFCFATIVCPLVWHLFHRWWGFDWFYSVVLGLIPALIVTQMLL